MGLRTRNRRKPRLIGQRWPLTPDVTMGQDFIAIQGEISITILDAYGEELQFVDTGAPTGISVRADSGGSPTGANLVTGFSIADQTLDIIFDGVAGDYWINVPPSDPKFRAENGGYLPEWIRMRTWA